MKLFTMLFVILSISAFTNNFESSNKGYEIGDVATDFKLMNVDGKMVFFVVTRACTVKAV